MPLLSKKLNHWVAVAFASKEPINLLTALVLVILFMLQKGLSYIEFEFAPIGFLYAACRLGNNAPEGST